MPSIKQSSLKVCHLFGKAGHYLKELLCDTPSCNNDKAERSMSRAHLAASGVDCWRK